jgi:hypothetical protein
MKHGLRMVTEHSKLVVVDGNESSFLQRHRVTKTIGPGTWRLNSVLSRPCPAHLFLLSIDRFIYGTKEK